MTQDIWARIKDRFESESLGELEIKGKGTLGGNLPDKQLCVLFGVERFGLARISPGTAIRSHRVGDIPAVWLGHLFFSSSAIGGISRTDRGRIKCERHSPASRRRSRFTDQLLANLFVVLRKKRANTASAPSARKSSMDQ
jgi:hypothetical protein